MKRSIRLGAFLCCFLFAGSAYSASFDVDPFADNDCSDFICDFQSALSAATNNGQDDTITLEGGDYDTSIGFFYFGTENKSLSIVGAGPEDTILDAGGINGVLGVTTLSATLDAQAEIEIKGIGFRNGNNTSNGGGLFVGTKDADIFVDNCKFIDNVTTGVVAGTQDIGGGGVTLSTTGNGSATLSNSVVVDNQAPQSLGGGALVYVISGDVTVVGNKFTGNSSLDLGGGGTFGGGLVAVAVMGDLTISRNTILDNSSQSAGGFAAVAVYGFGTVADNLVARNTANTTFSATPTQGFAGGAEIVSVFGTVYLTNNTIVENKVIGGGGGGLSLTGESSGQHIVSNNIIWGNSASGTICATSCNDILIEDDISGSATDGQTVKFANNDFADFFATCDPLLGCTPHRDIVAANNFNADPLFVNASQLNYNLSSASSLIDKGLATAPGIGDSDLDGGFRVIGGAPDLGALESPFTAGTPPATPIPTENCANNVDDDQDTLIDCLDPDCAGAAACQDSTPTPVDERENCGNNIDDDGNGLTDCADPICVGAVACPAAVPPDGEDTTDEDGGGANNVTSNSSCSLNLGRSSPASALYFLIPLSLALTLRRRNHGHIILDSIRAARRRAG